MTYETSYSVTMDTLYVRLVVLGRRPFAIHQSSLKRTTQGACSKYSTCNLLSLWWLLEKPFGLAFRKAVWFGFQKSRLVWLSEKPFGLAFRKAVWFGFQKSRLVWLSEKPFGLAFRKAVQDSGSFGGFFDGWSSPGDSSPSFVTGLLGGQCTYRQHFLGHFGCAQQSLYGLLQPLKYFSSKWTKVQLPWHLSWYLHIFGRSSLSGCFLFLLLPSPCPFFLPSCTLVYCIICFT